ncbi:hypothetical protein DRJ23_03970 [Candidatus Acetothermia bacterium]|nr:MAG: hypothetical protein DRJ23_03970 [Candidatus Acetothermia bacterium]
MKRLGKFMLLLVLGLTLLVSTVAVTGTAGPVHVGGSRASFGVVIDDPGSGFTPLSTPVHVGGS